MRNGAGSALKVAAVAGEEGGLVALPLVPNALKSIVLRILEDCLEDCAGCPDMA